MAASSFNTQGGFSLMDPETPDQMPHILHANPMKTILLAFCLSALLCHASAVELRRFPTVDGVLTKGEYIDTNPTTKERLDFRYGPIRDSGVELELTVGDKIVWREYVEPLYVSHSKYNHKVFVRVEDGKIYVTSVGARRIFEVRDL